MDIHPRGLGSNKGMHFKATLIRRGDDINLKFVAPQDFDPETERLIPTYGNVQSFIKKLVSRTDPVPTVAERLQFHAHSLKTLGRGQSADPNQDDLMCSALNFMSSQLFNWILKCTEYNKLPTFGASSIRLALLVRNQSKAAYSVSISLAF